MLNSSQDCHHYRRSISRQTLGLFVGVCLCSVASPRVSVIGFSFLRFDFTAWICSLGVMDDHEPCMGHISAAHSGSNVWFPKKFGVEQKWDRTHSLQKTSNNIESNKHVVEHLVCICYCCVANFKYKLAPFACRVDIAMLAVMHPAVILQRRC